MKKYEEPVIIIIFAEESDILASSTEGYIEFWGENGNE